MRDINSEGLASEIIRFFQRNRHVAETLEGLSRWRLHQEYVALTVDQVSAVLGRLVANGFLLSETRGAETFYRLNPARVPEGPLDGETNGADDSGWDSEDADRR